HLSNPTGIVNNNNSLAYQNSHHNLFNPTGIISNNNCLAYQNLNRNLFNPTGIISNNNNGRTYQNLNRNLFNPTRIISNDNGILACQYSYQNLFSPDQNPIRAVNTDHSNNFANGNLTRDQLIYIIFQLVKQLLDLLNNDNCQ